MTQYVRAINIANNSIKSFVFDSSVANTFNAASVASAVAISANVAAQAVSTFVTLQTQQVAALPPIINTISITDSSYNSLNVAELSISGGYLQITGSNFQSGAVVVVGSSNTALSTTFVDSTTLRAQIPALAAGTYPLYVVNSNGGTAINPIGGKVSPFPGSQLDNLWGWGQNYNGQLGTNDAIARSSPVQIGETYLWSNATSGAAHTLLLKGKSPTQTLWSMGRNFRGNLGQNDIINRSSPTQVGTGYWSSITVGYYFSAGIKSDGTLWTWGYGNYGALGLNSITDRSSPTQVGTGTNWAQIKSAASNLYAIKTDGTAWAWGPGYAIGNNSTIDRSSPVQIGALTNWLKFSESPCDSAYPAAIKTDGTLWVWGSNSLGQLGLNDKITRSSPVQIGTGTWNTISTSRHSVGIKTDGTLWTWGYNNSGYGALGLNSITDRSSPTQVGTETTWLNAVCLYQGVTALKSNGTLWSWGNNEDGQLGQNDINIRSSPVQIGTATDWSEVYAGHYSSIAKRNA
jgi:alpha-tubulin suppressor-like RCC1 family protein